MLKVSYPQVEIGRPPDRFFVSVLLNADDLFSTLRCLRSCFSYPGGPSPAGNFSDIVADLAATKTFARKGKSSGGSTWVFPLAKSSSRQAHQLGWNSFWVARLHKDWADIPRSKWRQIRRVSQCTTQSLPGRVLAYWKLQELWLYAASCNQWSRREVDCFCQGI